MVKKRSHMANDEVTEQRQWSNVTKRVTKQMMGSQMKGGVMAKSTGIPGGEVWDQRQG